MKFLCLLSRNSMFVLTGPREKASSSYPSYIRFLWPDGNNRYHNVVYLTKPCCSDWLTDCSGALLARMVFSDSLLFPHISFLTSLAITAPSPAITTWPGKMTMPLSPVLPSSHERHIFHACKLLCVFKLQEWIAEILAWWLVCCSRAPLSAPQTATHLWDAPCPGSTTCSTGHPSASAHL